MRKLLKTAFFLSSDLFRLLLGRFTIRFKLYIFLIGEFVDGHQRMFPLNVIIEKRLRGSEHPGKKEKLSKKNNDTKKNLQTSKIDYQKYLNKNTLRIEREKENK